MTMKVKIPMLENEVWYGGYVYGSEKMPLDQSEKILVDFYLNRTPNQGSQLLLSNKGRYLWDDGGFCAEFADGEICLDKEVPLQEGRNDLKGAYLDAMENHFPFRDIHLDRAFFSKPVYNTWIELTFNQNEKDILRYASDILANGMPAGILMIDDGWSDYYGKWTFNRERFPHAEEMIDKLHQMGFQVMLWVCPYVTPDTVVYREALKNGYLIMQNGEEPFILKWWNGYSAALDLSNPEAVQWLDQQFQDLCEMGIDGFKFDAGDSSYYNEQSVNGKQRNKGNISPNEMCRLWCLYGEKYRMNEFRAAWRVGGHSIMQRLCDKPHSWSEGGVQALIPDVLAQGILGMPFGCPDMIGGGEYLNFQENSENLDEELFVRHAEIACLMPVMQFSAAPWRVLKKENFERIKTSIAVREKYLDYLLTCAEDAARTGEPMVRYMEYEFPHQGMEKVKTQFMLGSKMLVAPVCEKGQNGRSVIIPEGSWDFEGEVIVGDGKAHVLHTEMGKPAILWKMN